MDFYGEELPVWRMNCHTHSKRSDGAFTAPELIERYRGAGYAALAFTDHGCCNPMSRYDGGGMRLISGIELHPRGPRGRNWHLLCLGVPEDFFPPPPETPAQTVIDQVNAAGGIVFVAHPYWCGFTAAEVMTLRGTVGLEVYNRTCRYIGKADSAPVWDEALDAGSRLTGLAVDDLHGGRDFAGGWVMAAAPDNSESALLDALRHGRFYATQGPEIRRLAWRDGVFEAEFSPCDEVVLMSNAERGFSCRMAGDAGAPVGSARFETGNLPPGSYLRLCLRDAEGRAAWANPVWA